MNRWLRVVLLVVFFAFCSHLDAIVAFVLAHTEFFQPQVAPKDAGWLQNLYHYGRTFVLEKLGDFIESLLILLSKLLWPFLFAAVAVPVTLPRPYRLRNRWSLTLLGISLLAVLVLGWLIRSDFFAFWHSLSGLTFVETGRLSAAAQKLGWAMVVVAISLVLGFTLAYRVLHRYKLEQLLYLFALLANAFYVLLLDPIPGEVDDAASLFITCFLAMAVLIDRLLTGEAPEANTGA